MQLEWEISENKSYDKKINSLTNSEILSQILANRGIDTYDKAYGFLNPTIMPFSSSNNFVDMDKAVERIKEAIEKSQNIVIYGDFDCDGVTSTAVLYKTLVKIGAKVGSYIPNRMSENHGLSSKAIVEIISQQKAKLIITVDNGISNVSEVKLAQSLGTDVIITDHHEPGETLPPAFAIINPKCMGKIIDGLNMSEIESMVNFAGVMVAYKLCSKLLESFNKKDFEKELIPLVTLGTISDVMPLVMENRTLVTLGLEIIKKNPPKWLKKIFKLSGNNIENVDSETLAFIVAPRINAAGRLESATTALELLVSDDEEKTDFCANQLQQFNQTRQQMCETSLYEATSKIQSEIDLKKVKAIVLADEKWHIGIVGLLASKIVEIYNRPAFIMSVDKEINQARCSIRGIKGLDVYKVLSEISEYLENFGGHELAGGFCIDLNKVSINDIASKINKVVLQHLSGKSMKKTMHIDAILSSESLTEDLIEKLSLLEPYGEGNKACILGIEDLVLKKISTIGNDAHLKLLFETKGKTAIYEGLIWQKNSHPIEVLDTADVTFMPKINEYNGKKTIQLIIKNIFIKNRKIETKNYDFVENPKEQALLVDHRNKSDFLKMLNSYLANNKSEVFLENNDTIKNISDYSAIKSLIKNRFSLEPNDELILLSSPCSEEDFSKIINMVTPQKVHIFNCHEKKLEVIDFIKTISGMLKYTSSHNNGEFNITKSLAFLSVTSDALDICMNLLDEAGVIKIKNQTEDTYLIEFLQSKAISDIMNTEKYTELENELSEINKFREEFQTCDFVQIKEMLEI